MTNITAQGPKSPINLLRGWPSPSVLPAALLSSAAQRVLVDPAVYTPILQYGPDPGYQPLREALAAWLGRHYAVKPDPERICITGGASQNLACVLQSFTEPTTTRAIWVTAPCYHLGCAIFEDNGFKGRLRACPEDEDGINVEILEGKIQELERQEKNIPRSQPYKDPEPFRKFYRHVIYVVTTCANPSGKTMPLKRREDLVTVARKYDALIISDDVYDFLQWPLDGEPSPERPAEMRIPRVCDVDLAMGRTADDGDEKDPRGFGNAISNGSFSKVAGPGVRTGWVEASPAFVLGLSKTGSTKSGGAPSQLSAAILSDLVRSGELEDWIETKTRPGLKRRHKVLMSAIDRYLVPLGDLDVRGSSLRGDRGIYGGYFVWFTLRDGLCSKMVGDVALKEENLIIGSGNMFEVHGDEESVKFNTEIRLCFSWEPEEVMVEGVRRLGDVLARIRANRAYYEEEASKAGGSDRRDAFK